MKSGYDCAAVVYNTLPYIKSPRLASPGKFSRHEPRYQHHSVLVLLPVPLLLTAFRLMCVYECGAFTAVHRKRFANPSKHWIQHSLDSNPHHQLHKLHVNPLRRAAAFLFFCLSLPFFLFSTSVVLNLFGSTEPILMHIVSWHPNPDYVFVTV